jgi:23S rRNA (uracil1939-C5)-methyltransferase
LSELLAIGRLGAQGDGVADTARGPLFVPFALPGEQVNADVGHGRAVLVSIERPSPLRIEPACRHFGACGGCVIQHLEHQAYRDWKRAIVVQALRSRGIETEVEALIPCEPHTRRRAVFTTRRTEAGMLFGFNRLASNEIVPVEECPVLAPGIVSTLGPLKTLAATVCATSKPFHVIATMTASGLDVAVRDGGRLGEAARRAAVRFAIEQGFARLSIDGEIVIEPRKPVVTFDGIAVSPPPGGFLQATEKAEQAMAALVGNHLARAKRIADLFSGCGTFALRLARHAEIHAVEGDAAALAALDRGFREASGLRRVTVERRDLVRRPLTARELARFDGLVFDPPRAGAEEQSKQVARSEVPFVAAVSCNPATLARDLRILVEGGYRLKSVTPVDQFLWSPHVEAVALLEKPRAIPGKVRRGFPSGIAGKQ